MTHDPQLIFLKRLVKTLGVLLVIGFAVLLVGGGLKLINASGDKSSSSSCSQLPYQLNLQQPQNTNIAHIAALEKNRLAVVIRTPQGDTLWIMDANNCQ